MLQSILRMTAIMLLTSQLGNPAMSQDDDPQPTARGKIVLKQSKHSDFHVFIPKKKPQRILVIAHGTPGSNDETTDLSKKFIERWTDFANKRRLLLISVAFNRENFASDSKYGYGGYRGLFGRTIGADRYVIELVESLQSQCSIQDGRFLLYGHSAGGQFLIRFCVTHPDRIAAAVASAPGRFAFPDSKVGWPYGMKRFSKTIKWSETESQKTVHEPQEKAFRSAARLPIVVLYGEQDTEEQPKRAAHPGKNRIDYGTGWVAAMNAFVKAEKPSVSLKIIPGIGHNSRLLTGPCQKAFVKLDWVEPAKTDVMRTWRSAGKKFTVNAKLVERVDDNVKLLTEAGKEIEVPVDKLSKTDLRFLEIETP